MTVHRPLRKKISSTRLRVVIRAQGNLCAGCGKPMLTVPFPVGHVNEPTEDHVIPKSRNGWDKLGNIVAMHSACNNAKGDDRPTGCELIWLIAVNCRIGVGPQKW